jgi:hypothetical protein
MNNNNNKSYEFFASFLLPEGILDWFDLVKVEEEKLKISKRMCTPVSCMYILMSGTTGSPVMSPYRNFVPMVSRSRL